ncbi:MAG: T9SS type A sorting domain-containing protein, partial [Bacteroidetes bacterium]|nr:T9SS type A sorting domain-containing protein [Bacteroidota bacterium]
VLAVSAQTGIPNSGFENWIDEESPVSWDASNIHDTYMGYIPVNIVTVTRSTDGYTGSYCAKMESMEIVIVSAVNPGFITLGNFWYTIDPQDGGVIGGIAFSGRPDSLAGYYKAQPVTGDKASFYLYLWKGADTIGTAEFQQPISATDWKYLSVPISYTSPDTPDSLNIIISSSDFYNEANIEGASLLLVDDLDLIYGSVRIIDVAFSNNFSVYADASLNQLIVRTRLENPCMTDISVISASGQCIWREACPMGNDEKRIALDYLPSGIYIVNIKTADGQRFSQKIAVNGK